MALSAHLLLSSPSKPSDPVNAREPDPLAGVSDPDSVLDGSGARGGAEPPLTSEPPLAHAAPLTSEPPLAVGMEPREI
ncbi:hypothetical protein RKE29_29800 [Streptomyces sp. B1866]|uniref:hypothetical protein n=1 Tax=Streptomyces sp. B1866 TaxID=3075431 RepID=UPI0028906EE5|nr:hypothetical protein [Streptomyces sp. B1866]MDT3400745.1 hypothetical protein [Streptomyces sp. B1866]